MNWNNWIRQTHRWVSIAFTLTVIANFVALGTGQAASRLDHLLAAAPARLAPVHRSVHVRAAVCRQMAQRKGERMNGRSAKEAKGPSPSKLIDAGSRSSETGEARTLSRLRALIRQADPDVTEEWKWGIPVWSHDGLICTGEIYKNAVKATSPRAPRSRTPRGSSTPASRATPGAPSTFTRATTRRERLEGAHSSRRGPEHVQSPQASQHVSFST